MEEVSPSVLGAGRFLWTLLGASLLALATNANYLQKKAMYYYHEIYLFSLSGKGNCAQQNPNFFQRTAVSSEILLSELRRAAAFMNVS